MSLSSLGLVNLITGVIAKKSAELAAASGALLAGAGILIGAHGVDIWNHAHSVQSDVVQTRQSIQHRQTNLQEMEHHIQSLSQKIGLSCHAPTAENATPDHTACLSTSRHAYTSLTQNMRALRLDLPLWAAKNGITINNIFAGTGGAITNPTATASGTGVPGFQGIAQNSVKVQGTYSTLNGLRHFVHHMPTGMELTGIHIAKNHFTAEITTYGLSA